MIASTTTLLSPILAQATGPSSSVCWAIVLLCVILGLVVALRPPHRTTEVKRRNE